MNIKNIIKKPFIFSSDNPLSLSSTTEATVYEFELINV